MRTIKIIIMYSAHILFFCYRPRLRKRWMFPVWTMALICWFGLICVTSLLSTNFLLYRQTLCIHLSSFISFFFTKHFFVYISSLCIVEEQPLSCLLCHPLFIFSLFTVGPFSSLCQFCPFQRKWQKLLVKESHEGTEHQKEDLTAQGQP